MNWPLALPATKYSYLVLDAWMIKRKSAFLQKLIFGGKPKILHGTYHSTSFVFVGLAMDKLLHIFICVHTPCSLFGLMSNKHSVFLYLCTFGTKTFGIKVLKDDVTRSSCITTRMVLSQEHSFWQLHWNSLKNSTIIPTFFFPSADSYTAAVESLLWGHLK